LLVRPSILHQKSKLKSFLSKKWWMLSWIVGHNMVAMSITLLPNCLWKRNREIFLTLPTRKIRLNWLTRRYNDKYGNWKIWEMFLSVFFRFLPYSTIFLYFISVFRLLLGSTFLLSTFYFRLYSYQ
jgi:hypothetical protein